MSDGYCGGDITWVYTNDPPELHVPNLGIVGIRGVSAATGVRRKATVTDGHYVFITTPWTFSDAAASTVVGVNPFYRCVVVVCV